MVSFIKKFWFCVPVTIGAGLLVLCLWLPGCVFDTSGIPPIRDWYECSTELWHCQLVADAKPDISLLKMPSSSANLIGSKNAICYPLMADKTKSYPLYYDKDVVIYSINDDELKGAMLVPTGFYEWQNSDEHYWGIQFNNAIEAFYVAYDSRAKIPDWLKKDYTSYRDKNNQMARITTSILDPSYPAGSGSPRFLTLDLYRYKRPLAIGNSIILPGNSFNFLGPNNQKQVKDWSEIKTGKPLMYTGLIRPKINWDCSSGKKIETAGFEQCFDRTSDSKQLAEFEAAQSWNQKFPFLAKKNIQCATYNDCASEHTLIGGALTVKPKTYIYRSEIQFGSPSSAKITIDHSSHPLSVKGQMHFEYLLKTHDLRLNSMRLSIDPFSTDHGDFSDIGIYLLETAMANCKGSTIADMPCDRYELKPTTFFCAESFKRNGKPHLFVSANNTSMAISIDHPSRSFTIKGSLASSAQVNGDTLPIDVDLNLTGKFVNFAPMPIGEESDTFSQCVENANKNPIHLNAAGSYDVYEPLPAYQAAYQWTEDYGMLTEKQWGQGKVVTIGKGQLAFGSHDITLSVEDAHGVAATTTLQVEVADTLPPQLQIPADVHIFFLKDPGPVAVPIGTAHASDMCSHEVMVTNNAPDNLVFPSNQISEVTWRAEDLRGNIATGIQRVNVMVLKPFRPQLERAVFLIKESIKQNQFELSACGDTARCFADITPVINGLDQLINLSAEATLPERQKSGLRRTITQLKPVRASLAKGQQNLERSNASQAERSNLRKSARTAVHTALEQMSKVME